MIPLVRQDSSLNIEGSLNLLIYESATRHGLELEDVASCSTRSDSWHVGRPTQNLHLKPRLSNAWIR
jgi:hypothetical protein